MDKNLRYITYIFLIICITLLIFWGVINISQPTVVLTGEIHGGFKANIYPSTAREITTKLEPLATLTPNPTPISTITYPTIEPLDDRERPDMDGKIKKRRDKTLTRDKKVSPRLKE